MLVIGLVVGVVVSLLQAVTQIQEQTLSFIPKIVAMVVSAIVLMPWMGQQLMNYAQEMWLAVICRAQECLEQALQFVTVYVLVVSASPP